jgi:hypothetical protein
LCVKWRPADEKRHHYRHCNRNKHFHCQPRVFSLCTFRVHRVNLE